MLLRFHASVAGTLWQLYTLADALRPVYHPGETWMKNLHRQNRIKQGAVGFWKMKKRKDAHMMNDWCVFLVLINDFLSNKNPWMMENHKSLKHALLACQHGHYSHTIGEFDGVKLLGLYSLFTILGGCWWFFWWLISCTTWSILLWVCLNILNHSSMSRNNGI